MTTHTTTTLKMLIIEKMHPENQMSNQEIQTWLGVLPEIKDELAKHMSFIVYSIFDNSLVKRQLQQMQTECTFLLNAIDKYDHCTGDVLLLRSHTIDCLNATLDTIITQYSKYADYSKNMNRMHFRQKIMEMNEQLIHTKEMMQIQELQKDLQKLILDGFQKVFNNKTANYNQVIYLSNFLPGLNEILHETGRAYAEDTLCQYLIQRSYNSELFIQFMLKRYQGMATIINLEDRNTAFLRLRSRLQRYKADAKNTRYLPGGDSIYSRLINFVETELRCAGIAIKNARPKLVPIVAPVPVPYKPIDYKLRFNFSVDCLAYLLKLMVNTNIIDPGIKAELQRYVAENFQTPGTKSIGMSAGSFQTKYKNVTQSTSATVKAALMAMLKLIDKEF
jgi:hypothetical protein